MKIGRFNFSARSLLILFTVLCLSLFTTLVVVRAWTEPTAAPPGDNVAQPINIGLVDQAKQGNLAIGTTSINPAYQLFVSGERISGSAWTCLQGYGSSNVCLYQPNNNNDLRFWVNGDTRMKITETGQVGIGTPAPTPDANTTLDVEGNTLMNRVSVGTPLLTLQQDMTSMCVECDTLRWKHTDGTIKGRIDKQGYLGLGNISPSSALDIDGLLNMRGVMATGSAAQMQQSGVEVSPAGQGRIAFDALTNKFVASENGGVYVPIVGSGTGTPGGSNTQVQFNDDSTFGGNDGLIYNKDTKVLTINAAGAGLVAPLIIKTAENASTGGYISFQHTTNEKGQVGYGDLCGGGDANGMTICSAVRTVQFGGAGSTDLTIKNGNVGIGTINPGAKLEVNGQIKITDGNQGANKVLTSDANGLASWQAVSQGGLPVGQDHQTLRYKGETGEWIATDAIKLDDLDGSGVGAKISMGSSTATGSDSVAMGNSCHAEGEGSFCMGNSGYARGDYSFADGYAAVANGDGAIALGWGAWAQAARSIALGNTNYSEQEQSVSIGNNIFNDYANSIVIGTGTPNNNEVAKMLHGAAAQSLSVGFNSTIPTLFVGTSSGAGTTGNVGIGTINPGAKLEVNGQIKITDGNQGANKVLTSDANGLASWQAATSSQWTTSGSNIYYNTGNVGIGNNSPAGTLTVQSASANTTPVLSLSGTTPSTPLSFQWSLNTNERASVLTGATGANSYHTLLLGTNTPEANNNSLGYIQFGQTQSGKVNADGFSGLKAGIQGIASGAGGAAYGFGGALAFGTRGDNSTYAERMRINNAGNVGIGTASPAARLDVQGTSQHALIGDWGGSTNYMAIGLANSIASGNYNILSGTGDTNLYLNRPTGKSMNFRMNNVDQMYLDANGYLYLPTVHIIASTANSSTARWVDATKELYLYSSSARFKTDIQNANIINNPVSQLQLRTFKAKEGYAADESDPSELGLIAEEAYQIAPEVVSLGADGKPMGINDIRLNYLQLDAIQKLQKENQDQQKQIDSLLQRVNQLESICK